MRRLPLAALVLAALLLPGATARAQDLLTRAKDYYTSAAYEEALQVLNALGHDATGADATEIATYQVFCLYALGRHDEAASAVEAIVRADPFFYPAAGEVSPSVLAFFEDARRPLLPSVVRDVYADARKAFDRKDMETAAAGFDRVIDLLDDIEVLSPEDGDLRTLAEGFRDLSRLAAAPPVEAPPPADTVAGADVAAIPTNAPAGAGPAGNGLPAVPYADVQLPVAISKRMPVWRPGNSELDRQEFRGRLDLVIDNLGRVTSATITRSIHPAYDPLLLRAVPQWRFRPATRAGVPVPYHLSMEIVLKP